MLHRLDIARRAVHLALPLAALLTTAAARPALAASQTALAIPLSGIRLDGDLSDWPEGTPRQSIVNDFDVYGATDVSGQDLTRSDDLTPTMRVGYDDRSDLLYLGVEVRDDVNANPRSPSHLTSDGVEIYVAGLQAPVPSSSPMKYVMTPGDHQFAGFTGNPGMMGGGIGRTRTRAVWRREEGVTTYEWQLDVLGDDRQRVDLNPGDVVGLDVVVVDYDGPGRGGTAWVPWGPSIGQKWESNERIGRILLGGGPAFSEDDRIEPEDLVKSTWTARLAGIRQGDVHGNLPREFSHTDHREHVHDLANSVGALVAGILAGVEEVATDDNIIQLMRQEGATDRELDEMRDGLAEARQELARARAELSRGVVDAERIQIDVRDAIRRAHLGEAIARAARARALSAAEAREIAIPEPPEPPQIHIEVDTDHDWGHERDAAFGGIVWSTVCAFGFLLGAIGLAHFVGRRRERCIRKTAADSSFVERVEQIEQRLTDTQDVMIALSEKLDRIDGQAKE